MARVALVLVWVSVAIAGVGFFLPWARIDLHEPGLAKQLREVSLDRDTLGGFTKDVGRITVKIRRGAETITGELPSLSDIPKQVSGFQIPQLANQNHAQVAEALWELLTTERHHLGTKSYAVYLLPGIALCCGLVLTWVVGNAPVAVGITVLCGLIAGVGYWKLLTTDTQTLFIAITIGPGLWLSLLGYVGLAVVAGWCAVRARSRAPD